MQQCWKAAILHGKAIAPAKAIAFKKKSSVWVKNKNPKNMPKMILQEH